MSNFATEMTIEDMIDRDISNLNNTLGHLISEQFPNIYLVRDQMYFYIYEHGNKEKLGYFKTTEGCISYLNIEHMELFGEMSNLLNFLRRNPYAIFALELCGFVKQRYQVEQ
ncbi:hypothetical protein FKOIJHOC_00114 [Acinetobacter phage Ab_121]|nr:hypothetical protein FKOIJHOC_00114 [Acinetobacter phage Ab_121]